MSTGRLIVEILIPAIFLVLLGLGVLSVCFASAREMAIWLLLRRYGKVREAAIVELCIYRPNFNPSYYIRFKPSGDDETSVIQAIRDKNYKRLQERTFVIISYLPTAPHVARLWGKDADNVIRDVYTLIMIVFIVFASFMVTVWPLVGLWLLIIMVLYIAPRLLSYSTLKRMDSWECAE